MIDGWAMKEGGRGMGDLRASMAAILTVGLLLPADCCRAEGTVGSSYPSPQYEVIKKVRLDQKLDAQVPLDLTFRDETGKAVRLGDYFGRKPVLLNLIQYRCTMLCSQEMKILAASLKELKFSVGDQFEVVTLSID